MTVKRLFILSEGEQKMSQRLSVVTQVALREFVESRKPTNTIQILCRLASDIGDLAYLLELAEKETPTELRFHYCVSRIVKAASDYANLKQVNLSDCERTYVTREAFHGNSVVELGVLLTCLAKLFICPIKGIEMTNALRGVFFSTRAILAKYYPKSSLEEIMAVMNERD